MQNTNTNTTHDNANARFYACFDNDNLSPERAMEASDAIAAMPDVYPERLVGAVDANAILTENPNVTGLMLRYERNPHQILAYISRIINPIQQQREVMFVSKSPFDGSLWLSRDVEGIDVVSRQYWLNATLALSTYLKLMGGAITRRKLGSTRKLVQVQPPPGASSGVHYQVDNDACTRVIHSGSGESTTWELITPKHGSRTLRTFNPAESR